MSKYKIATYPQEKYRFELFDNLGQLMWQEIKKRTGCCALVNCGISRWRPSRG